MQGSVETIARKIRTLSDKIYSRVAAVADGMGPGFTYAERLDYLRLRQVFRGNKNMVLYDIGANQGLLSAFWAKLPQVEIIYAFEPVASVFAELQGKAANEPKIIPVNTALGDSRGELTINVNEWNPSSSLLPLSSRHMTEFPFATESRREKIRLARLDDLAAEKGFKPPDLVKIDVQGFEDKVLSGGAKTIGRARHCIIELSLDKLYQGSAQITDIITMMDGLDFDLVDIVGEVTGQAGRLVQVDGLFRKRNVGQ